MQLRAALTRPFRPMVGLLPQCNKWQPHCPRGWACARHTPLPGLQTALAWCVACPGPHPAARPPGCSGTVRGLSGAPGRLRGAVRPPCSTLACPPALVCTTGGWQSSWMVGACGKHSQGAVYRAKREGRPGKGGVGLVLGEWWVGAGCCAGSRPGGWAASPTQVRRAEQASPGLVEPGCAHPALTLLALALSLYGKLIASHHTAVDMHHITYAVKTRRQANCLEPGARGGARHAARAHRLTPHKL